MDLNDLLQAKEIDPEHVLVFRHRPHEPGLRKVLPWLAAEKPDFFNAYQQTQEAKLERVMGAMRGAVMLHRLLDTNPAKHYSLAYIQSLHRNLSLMRSTGGFERTTK
jgi:hypothetical protein